MSTGALACLETYQSFQIIDPSNNQVLVLINGAWQKFTFPTGSYDISDLNPELQCQIVEKGRKSNSVTIIPNHNAVKCIMTITDAEVNLKGDNSIRTVLGFGPKTVS